jgi:2-succinyl-5-enolpyruvyl-6-hydroxy-3-cyclohexene-1-carboxylate synthase
MSDILPPSALQVFLTCTSAREFIICAGARNSALLVMLAAVPGLRLWHHFEERAAAFFALGRILDHGHPVAVVTTSGTAAAELLPAMIEAHYQGLPLIALTADRPVSYRGSGAPQAIEQAGIFGCYPKMACDVTSLETAPEDLGPLINWDADGPLHVNLCLEEPDAAALPFLRMAGSALNTGLRAGNPPDAADSDRWPAPADFPDPLILIGDLLAREIPAVEEFAASLGRPVYAEAASGLRESGRLRHLLLGGGDQVLKQQPHRSVIRLGGVPACRFWRDLENRPDIPVCSCSRSGHSGLARASLVRSLPRRSVAASLGDAVPALDSKLSSLLAAHPASEPAMVHALSKAIPAGAVVFTGNSLAIRQWNLVAQPSHPIHARALRGANGIDGNLSAFLGLAADATEAWCLVGDLTALYDLAAPWILTQMPAPRLRIVVIQNAGGKIFSQLPALAGLTPFERQLMENPHHISLAGWASQWNLAHLACTHSLPALTDLPDRVVIELFPDPTATAAFWEGWRA